MHASSNVPDLSPANELLWLSQMPHPSQFTLHDCKILRCQVPSDKTAEAVTVFGELAVVQAEALGEALVVVGTSVEGQHMLTAVEAWAAASSASFGAGASSASAGALAVAAASSVEA